MCFLVGHEMRWETKGKTPKCTFETCICGELCIHLERLQLDYFTVLILTFWCPSRLSICNTYVIGLAALLLLHGAGEVLAFTSLMGTFTSHPLETIKSSGDGWKCAFMASFLLTVQLLVNLPNFNAANGGIFDPATYTPLWVVAVSGLLAGFGTKCANGCTSGHGISGVGRMSPRSIVAVCTFMGMAFFTASFCSPAFPRIYKATRLEEGVLYQSNIATGFGIFFTALFCVATIVNVFFVVRERRLAQQTQDLSSSDDDNAKEEDTGTVPATAHSANKEEETVSPDEDKDIEAQESAAEDEEKRPEANDNDDKADGEQDEADRPFSNDDEPRQPQQDSADVSPTDISYFLEIIYAMAAAPTFAFGLSFGGMAKQSKILGFFDLTGFTREEYDPSLMFLFGAGCATSFVAYQFVSGQGISFIQSRNPYVRTRSLSGDIYHICKANKITKSLVIGSAIFGVSLGIAGFCPTPCLIMALAGRWDAFFVWLPLFLVGRVMHMICFGKREKERARQRHRQHKKQSRRNTSRSSSSRESSFEGYWQSFHRAPAG